VHDFFDVLGLPNNAPVSEIRRACARRVRRSHPDFGGAARTVACAPRSFDAADARPVDPDVAIDFVDMTSLLDRIQHGFFGRDR
jgi:hypothetical protein